MRGSTAWPQAMDIGGSNEACKERGYLQLWRSRLSTLPITTCPDLTGDPVSCGTRFSECRQVSCLNISQCLNPSRGSLDREDTSFDALWDLPGWESQWSGQCYRHLPTHEALGEAEDSLIASSFSLGAVQEIHTVYCESIGTGSQSTFAKLPVVVQDCGMASLQIVA